MILKLCSFLSYHHRFEFHQKMRNQIELFSISLDVKLQSNVGNVGLERGKFKHLRFDIIFSPKCIGIEKQFELVESHEQFNSFPVESLLISIFKQV